MPVLQDDGPAKVCAIAYTPPFEEIMNYFRAIVQMDERSERALEITRLVIDENPANYTAWYYRALVLADLKKDPKEELDFVADLAFDNAKNYQIWHHRRLMVERLDTDGRDELQFTTEILDADDDAKNYHAWAHRQWVLKRFNLWDGELDYIEQLLARDVRNNSAWNQRYFVVSNTEGEGLDTARREVEFAFSYIKKGPNNQCPWNYLRGWLRHLPDHSDVLERCTEMSKKYILCSHLFGLLVDLHAARGEDGREAAIEACTKLIESADIMRSKYWTYRRDQLQGAASCTA